MGQEAFEVVVVGSCMIDLVCYTTRMPKVGETIHGNSFEIGNGGKGANQCVAAAKLDAKTALIARVGDDDFGQKYIASLKSLGVHTNHVATTQNQMSGMAQITVAENGDNIIVIVAGANNQLSFQDVRKAQDVLLSSKIVIFQLETPMETTLKTLEYIKYDDMAPRLEGPLTFLNGAPAVSNLDPKLLKMSDVFCVNETEAAAITKVEVKDISSGKEAVKQLHKLGCQMVILTLGGQGVIFGSPDSNLEHVGVENLSPVDTTGAGDCFVGAFGFYTAKHPSLSMKEKIKRSAFIASQSVLKKGTQSSFPFKHELPQDLFTN